MMSVVGTSRHLVRCSDMSGVVLGVNRTRHRRSRFVSRAGLEPFAVCMERLLFALVFSHGREAIHEEVGLRMVSLGNGHSPRLPNGARQ